MPSDPETIQRWLNDIQHHITLAEDFVGGVSDGPIEDDNSRVHHAPRCSRMISKAASRLPDDVKARFTTIDWRNMAGASNIGRHDHGHVESSVREVLPDHRPSRRAVTETDPAAIGDR